MRNRLQTRSVAAIVAALGLMLVGLGAIAVDSGPAHALTNCDTGDISLDGEEQSFLLLINQYRAQNGLGVLTASTNLNRAATWMTRDMATKGYFSHTDSLGRTSQQRAIDCGYPQGAGENIAAGTVWSSAQAAFDAWKASPGHNANMLGSSYRQIGIARYFLAGSPYSWYWVTNFGLVDDGTGGPPPATNTPSASTSTPSTPPTSSPTTPPTSTPTASPATATAAPTRTPTPLATATASPTPQPAASGASGSTLQLRPGANLLAWPGSDAPPADALRGLTGIVAVYAYDPATGQWLRFVPGLPSFVSNLSRMHRGQAYWFISTTTATLPIVN